MRALTTPELHELRAAMRTVERLLAIARGEAREPAEVERDAQGNPTQTVPEPAPLAEPEPAPRPYTLAELLGR